MDVLINPTAESYGVDANTLREWLNRLPKLTSEEKISVPTTKTEIKAEKIIKKFHPDKYDAYTLIRQNLELYDAGCKAAVKKCVKQYIRSSLHNHQCPHPSVRSLPGIQPDGYKHEPLFSLQEQFLFLAVSAVLAASVQAEPEQTRYC